MGPISGGGGGSNKQQMYGNLEGFPENHSALFGLVSNGPLDYDLVPDPTNDHLDYHIKLSKCVTNH